MLKNWKAWLAAGMAIVMLLLSAVACGNEKVENNGEKSSSTETKNAGAESDPADAENYWEILNKVSDSSELPSWTGKQLELRYWYAIGQGGQKYKLKSDGDVVIPEIERVTGIEVKEIFDNGGQGPEVKLSMMAAADDFPEIAVIQSGRTGSMEKLFTNNKLYDMTELIPQYMPNLTEKMPTDKLKNIWQKPEYSYEGRLYVIPTALNEAAYAEINGVDKNKYSVFTSPFEAQGYIWVRDDILKKLYPNAKTMNEIENIYMQKGSFTKEEIFDVPINSIDDFFKFLYDIKKVIEENNIKEGNQPVSAFFEWDGTDNWNLLQALQSSLANGNINYITNWNKKTQSIELAFKQPWFKNMLMKWNKLVQDGVASKEAFVDTNAIFKEKMDKGLYAVSYGANVPDNNLYEKTGKPYRYRKVYLNMPESEQYIDYEMLPYVPSQIIIFKDKVKEENLEQVLRWIDFMMSDVGEKLAVWGPKSADLWEEKEGIRLFKDKELEQQVVYGAEGDKWKYYNLDSAGKGAEIREAAMPVWQSVRNWRNKFHPAYTYDRVRTPSEANIYFASGQVLPYDGIKAQRVVPWLFDALVPEMQKAWQARPSWETALQKALVAKDDAEFEKLYSDFVSAMDKSGYTDDVLAKIDKAYKEEINKDYMDNLK